MKNIDRLYIETELGIARSELGREAESDILDNGIECSTEEVYELAFSSDSQEDDELLQLLFDNKDESMLYPVYCFDELSFADWSKYKIERECVYKQSLAERECEIKIQDAKWEYEKKLEALKMKYKKEVK